MLADEQWGVPVPPVGLFAFLFDGFDRQILPAAAIKAHQSTVLALGINDIGIGGIYLRLEAIAGGGDVPVGIDDAIGRGVAAGSAQAQIVLCAAVHVVEGIIVVCRHLVELGHRQIGLEIPGFGVIKSLIDAPVAADQEVVGIVRIDPYAMVVDVLVEFAQVADRLAPVAAHFIVYVGNVNPVDIMRIAGEFLVVVA